MGQKSDKYDSSIDPIDLIESMYDLIVLARDSAPPISFIDSLALTSLTKTLSYIDSSIEIDSLDYRTRFMISEIGNFADSIAIRLLCAITPQGRLNYNYPLAFPISCIRTTANSVNNSDSRYDWLIANLEQIGTEGELPDDIDSTWSALYALSMHRWRQQAIPTRIFASSIRNLESVRQVDSNHIFNAWFVENFNSDSEWASADIVAMSSVTAFFDVIDPSHLPDTRSFIFNKLITYLQNPIESLWFSDFYHSLPLAIYMISRSVWSAEQRRELVTYLIEILRSEESVHITYRVQIHNPTDAYLYLSALMRLIDSGNNTTFDISELLPLAEFCMNSESITMTISDPLYIHSLRDNKTTYAMSSVISSLLMFESMFGMIHFLKKEKTAQDDIMTPIPSPYSGEYAELTDNILVTLQNFEVLKNRKEMIDRLIAGTDFNICLDICIAMMPDDIHNVEEAMKTHALGLCAYYLYDKIYDEELPPQTLPVLFLTNSVFQEHLQRLMNGLDAQDVDIPEEIQSIISNTDISYYVLSERGTNSPLFLHSRKSMGTSLIPIISMVKGGVSAGVIKYVLRFFEHFNLARQISDDAKDAEQDCTATNPKITTMSTLYSQRSIEYSIFQEIFAAKSAIDSMVRITTDRSDSHLQSIYYSLRKHLDEFLIKVLRAKWELSVIKNL